MINKIRLRKDFINIQNNGNKNVCSSFIIQSYKNNSHNQPSRFGFTASKKVGGAVVRNKAKRRMRELVYSLKDRFKEFGYDYVLIARKNLVDNGAKEITLLGQNVNAYSFIDGAKEYRLSDLINTLSKYNEISRIRYTTSHPRDMTDDLIECYKNSKKLMPFVHLPIQSGSDRILKMMNRKHTVNYYLNIYEKLIKINPDIKFSSDFIIGYPGETENDFKETINLVNKIKFINSFSFIFSPRPGTKAAELEITDKDKLKNRLITIQEKLFSNQIELNKSLEGKTLEVLVENKLKNQNKFFGRNKYLNSVIFDGNESHIGKLIKVNIEKSNQNSLFGKVIDEMKAA